MSDEMEWEDAGDDHPLSPTYNAKNAVQRHKDHDVLREEHAQGDAQEEASDQRALPQDADDEEIGRRQRRNAIVSRHDDQDSFGDGSPGDGQFGDSHGSQSHRIGGISISFSAFSDDEDDEEGDEHKPKSQRAGQKAGLELRLSISLGEPSPASKRKGDPSQREDKSQSHDKSSAEDAFGESKEQDRGGEKAPKTQKNIHEAKKASFEININFGDDEPKFVHSEKHGFKMKTKTEGSGWNKNTERHIDVMGGIKNLFSKKNKGANSKKNDSKSAAKSDTKTTGSSGPKQEIVMQDMKSKK